MPTTNRSGVEIHFETLGCGRPVVLLHGMMGRLESWRMEGYVAGLKHDHRLVLIDARGHGRSGRPTRPEAYRSTCQANDVLAVLDEIGLERASVVGWSMGAVTALRIAATHPHRLDAVAAIGASVVVGLVGFEDVTVPAFDGEAWASEFATEGMGEATRALEREGRRRWAEFLRRADAEAMAACARGLERTDPVAARLADIETPLLFAWGALEAPEEPLPLPRGTRVVVIPGEDHVGAFRRSDVLVPEIRRLVARAAPERPLAVAAAAALPF